MPAVLSFHDARLQALLGPVVGDGVLGRDAFFAAAERLSELDAEDLERLQRGLVAALIAGAYDLAALPDDPVRFADDEDDEDLTAVLAAIAVSHGMPVERVLPQGADLLHALHDLDEARRTRGTRATARMLDHLVAGDGNGYSADLRLVGILPRAHRLSTGLVMPGYRVSIGEELHAGSRRPEHRGVVVEVRHPGGRGLLAFRFRTASSAQLEDDMTRAVQALRAVAGPFDVLAIRPGDPFASPADEDDLPNGKDAFDGAVLHRGDLELPDGPADWARRARAALLRPARARRRAMPVDDVWAVLRAVDPVDLEHSIARAADRLAKAAPTRIEAFGRGLRDLLETLDRPDVVAAAERAFGWLSADASEDVRLGVIAAGREVYERAMADPTAVDWASIGPAEELLSLATAAYEQRTGEELDLEPEPELGRPTGATVVSRTRRDGGTEVCVRWWADHRLALREHLALEDAGAEVVAVVVDPPRERLREEFQGIGPVVLL